MGKVSYGWNGNQWEGWLSRACCLGRHPNCCVVLDHPDIPVFWIEVRFKGGEWWWRDLRPDDGRSRSRGEILQDGWHRFRGENGEIASIECGEDVWLRLSDPGPPTLFARDLASGALLCGSELEPFIEVWPDQARRIGWESGDGGFVADYSVHPFPTRCLQFHIPVSSLPRGGSGVTLDSSDCTLQVFSYALRAVFSQGDAECAITGSCVRVLWVYVLARVSEEYPEGWLSEEDAVQLWHQTLRQTHGARPQMDFERGRLRERLGASGAGELADLFETQKVSDVYQIRLRMPPERIALNSKGGIG